ncbi:uncharacterized protein [Lepeophtheirus salmonis]|nr:uncharacterized protein LOC121116123 isoform X2 [Lepeophtheirus salmonis]
MPSTGPLVPHQSPKQKPEIPAKPDLKARKLHHSEVRKSLKLDERESTLTSSPSRRNPPPLPSRKKITGKLVTANGLTLKESTQEILAKKHQLLSASLILKAAASSHKPTVPPKPPRPLSTYNNFKESEEVRDQQSRALARSDPSKSTLFTSFFNRLTSLRRSFNRGDKPSTSYAHQDWTSFFREKSSSLEVEGDQNTYAEIDESLHGRYLTIPKEVPIAPPRRKRPRIAAHLRRSLSFTDAYVIAQAVVEGDGSLIRELYPDFPRSEEPLYAIVDLSRKKKHRQTLVEMSPYRRLESSNIYEECNGVGEAPPIPPRPGFIRNNNPLETSSSVSTIGLVGEDPFITPIKSDNQTHTKIKSSESPSLDFYCPKEPPLVISPWNNSSTPSSNQNLIIECPSTSNTPKYNISHPFAQRTRSHYENNNHEIDQGANIGLRRSDDSFQKILDTADSSLLQAESILSSLRISHNEEEEEAMEDDETESLWRRDNEEEEDVSSDIESNIRRLEMTQAKINEALETFRQVQLSRRSDNAGSVVGPFKTTPIKGRKILRGSLSQTAPPKVEKMMRKGNSHSTLVESTTNNVSGMDNHHQNSQQQEQQQQNSTRSMKPPGLFRRHSFNLQHNNNNAPASSSSNQHSNQKESNGHNTNWYDEENHQDHDASGGGGYSDSEGGGIRRRIRGLFGSFGKGGNSSSTTGNSNSGSTSSVFYTGNSSTAGHKKNEDLGSKAGDPSLLSKFNSSELFSQTVGEFTRRIESLNRPPEDENQSKSSSSSSSCSSSVAHHQTYSRLKYHATLAKNDSNDTSSLGSGSQFSNRHSVISTHSLSSFEHDDDDSDEEQNKHPSSVSSSGPLEEEDEEAEPNPGRRKKKQVFYIAREIMTSERVFVDVLHLLDVELKDFIDSKRRNGKKLIPEGDLNKIFSNLSELHALNKDLLSDFEERIQNWETFPKIADVIVKKGPFLKLYTTYIREFSDVNMHFDECLMKYQKFAKVVKEFESLERCRNLKIKHFMLKPVQRLPQYKLLLEDYLKHLDPVNSLDFDDTTNALRIVSDAAEHANDTIRQGDKFRRMLKLQSRLGDQELIRPGRELIKEGELQKISRKGIGPRYFILLSDVLLYATYSSGNRSDSSGLRVSYSIPLNTLSVRVLPHYETEFSVSSPVRSCTLRASSVSERNEWIEALNHGIEEHRNRKATFFPGSSSDIDCDQLDVVGNCAPVWIPDRRVTMCQNCTVEFSVLVRRHHCRACGKVVCASCSGNKAPLRYKGFEVGRVCDECFDSLERELGHVENLKHRFKKRHLSNNLERQTGSGLISSGPGLPGSYPTHPHGRYVPGRLKVRAVGEGAQMSGYLKRRIQKSGKWKRMWYVLKDRVLYAYRASEDTVATDTFPVLGFTLDTLSDKNFELYEGESADLVFQLTHPGSESLIFCAENDNVSEKWITALGEAVKLNSPPVGTLIEI